MSRDPSLRDSDLPQPGGGAAVQHFGRRLGGSTRQREVSGGLGVRLDGTTGR